MGFSGFHNFCVITFLPDFCLILFLGRHFIFSLLAAIPGDCTYNSHSALIPFSPICVTRTVINYKRWGRVAGGATFALNNGAF